MRPFVLTALGSGLALALGALPAAAQPGPFPSDAFPAEGEMTDAGVLSGGGLNTDLVGVYNARSRYADVWGYAAPNGREYALGALQGSGLVVVDVTAEPPVEVAFVPLSPGTSDSKEVETYGTYAYVVNEIGPMQIVSLADPTQPVVVGQLDTQPGVPQGGQHTHAIVGERMYVHGGRRSNGGLGGIRVYSLADPVAPAFLGAYEPFYVHDIGVSGTTLYAAGIYGEGIDIVDAADPAAMTRRTLFNYPGSGAHNVCLTTDGRYAYVGDEIGTSGRWTRIFDVQNPDNVEMVGEIIVDAEAVVHNCYVAGNRLFLAHYTEGLRVFDISAPTAPVEIAFYDTYPGAGYGFNGAWAVYPYLPSGKILVSDRTGGISVVRLTGGAVAAEPAPGGAVDLAVGPNPVRGQSQLRYTLAEAADVRVTLTDLLGREVAVLATGRQAAGARVVPLDGRALAPGVYVVRLTLGGRAGGSRLVSVVR